MAKKVLLETRSEPAFFTLVGISCHLMDYRLIYSLNKDLEFNFVKESDFHLSTTDSGKTTEGFSFYLYRDEDHRISYYLFSNRNREAILFPALKQVDFILIMEGLLQKGKKENLMTTLRKIPNLLTAFELKFSEIKHYESFLTDIEMHIFEINRGVNQKLIRSK